MPNFMPRCAIEALARRRLLEPDLQRAALVLQAIGAQAALGVGERRARSDVELPEMLEARQHRTIVNTLLERNRFVRAFRLIREVLSAGVHDEHLHRPVDAQLLHAVLSPLVPATHRLPHESRLRASPECCPIVPQSRCTMRCITRPTSSRRAKHLTPAVGSRYWIRTSRLARSVDPLTQDTS